MNDIKTPEMKNQFNKIKLWDEIANQIAYFGVTQGNSTFMDYVDMNCGGIPDGEFEQIIDPAAPEEFLRLYMQIAENRFAFAVTGLLGMNQAYMPALEKFLYQTGEDMKIEGVSALEQAFEILNAFILDGMPSDETKKITERLEKSIIWEKITDTHKGAWDKAGGNLEVYYHLQQCFVNGLLCRSNIKYEIEEEKIFSLHFNI